MILIEEFNRLIRSVKNKIFLLLARGIISAVDNTEGTQKLSLGLLQSESASGIERLEDYGITSYPKIGPDAKPEVLAVFLNGNRNNGLVIKAHDRYYRPVDGVEGEVILYTWEDKTGLDNRIHFKTGKIHEHKCASQLITATTSEVHTTPLFQVVSALVQLGVTASVKKLINEDFITLYNAHKHGAGAVPNVPAGAAHQTVNTKAS